LGFHKVYKVKRFLSIKMRDRIEKILKIEQISSAKFADEIGIQRSTMSHILAGRNNPSLEVFQRILRKFPNINSDWLVLGIGEMYKNAKTSDYIGSLFEETKKEPTKETIQAIEPEKNKEDRVVAINLPTEENIKIPSISKEIEKIIVFYNDKTFEIYNNCE